MRFGVVLLLAIVEWAAAAVFDLNSDVWDWWTWALRVLAVLTLVLAFAPIRRAPAWTLVAALPVACACLAVSAARFNDSYRGTRVWPDVLAVVFFAACAAATAAVVARSPRASA
jgi:hypothetical protein